MANRIKQATTLLELARACRQAPAEIARVTRDARNSLAGVLLSDLTLITPVDTSQALSNWVVSPAPAGSELPPHVEGKGGSTRNASAKVAYAKGKSAMRKIPVGTSLFLVNYAGHIDLLEYKGVSPQQAKGFVARTVANAAAQADVVLAQELSKRGY